MAQIKSILTVLFIFFAVLFTAGVKGIGHDGLYFCEDEAFQGNCEVRRVRAHKCHSIKHMVLNNKISSMKALPQSRCIVYNGPHCTGGTSRVTPVGNWYLSETRPKQVDRISSFRCWHTWPGLRPPFNNGQDGHEQDGDEDGDGGDESEVDSDGDEASSMD